MGIFHVACEVSRVAIPRKSVHVPRLLVDSRSELTWIPEPLLKQAGIRPAKRDQVFVIANGVEVTRSTGYAFLRSKEFETVDEVVFAQPGDLAILGSRTLEGFRAAVDARRKRLVPGGPHPAAVSGPREARLAAG